MSAKPRGLYRAHRGDPAHRDDPVTLFDRLVAMDAIDSCFDYGYRRSSLPPSLWRDACQETAIAMSSKLVDENWYAGQLVNCGKEIAKGTFIRVYREVAQQCTIPRDVYKAHAPNSYHAKMDMQEAVTENSMHAFGVYGHDDPIENLTREYLADQAMGARIIESLAPAQRARVESTLQGLPDSLFRLTYLVVFLGYGLSAACDVMGIRYESGQKYIERLTRLLEQPNDTQDDICP